MFNTQLSRKYKEILSQTKSVKYSYGEEVSRDSKSDGKCSILIWRRSIKRFSVRREVLSTYLAKKYQDILSQTESVQYSFGEEESRDSQSDILSQTESVQYSFGEEVSRDSKSDGKC